MGTIYYKQLNKIIDMRYLTIMDYNEGATYQIDLRDYFDSKEEMLKVSMDDEALMDFIIENSDLKMSEIYYMISDDLVTYNNF